MSTAPLGPLVYTLADVSHQSIQLTDRYNTTFDIGLSDIAYYVNYGVISGIIYASQIGACLAVLIILLMLTKAEKQKSPVFILNSASLLFNTLGALMQCLYFTGPWFSPYVYLSGDYLVVPGYAKRISIAPGTFIILVTVAIEASLVLQLKVVCVTLKPMQRLLVTLVSMVVAFIAIGFRIAQVALNTQCNIVKAARCTEYLWVYKAMAITTTTSICFFSFAFCLKLGWSLYQRKKMGLTQFGPMQIIFIGGFQTLIIPVIFAILQFAVSVPEISSNILTVTAISLPLSSLWASGSAKNPSAGARGPDAHRKFIVDSSTGTSSSGGGGIASRNKSIGETYGAAGSHDESAALAGGGGVAYGRNRTGGKVGVLSSTGSGEYSVDDGDGRTPRSGRFGTQEGLVEKDLEMQDLRFK
ncbi:hypothetical protein AAFC00_004816 [Neodothiora populina]|uniref:Pheromone alpha factor receptor n=1 Tax=Neodothiora populina TaxID=2781224 RepID=A0ABR3P391_9PEZI